MHFVKTGQQDPHRSPAQVIAARGDETGRRLYLRGRFCVPRRLGSALELVGGLVTMALFFGVAILL